MISTAADLDRFITALFRGSLLPPAQQRLVFEVPNVKSAADNTNCVGQAACCSIGGLLRSGESIWSQHYVVAGGQGLVHDPPLSSRARSSRVGQPGGDRGRIAVVGFGGLELLPGHGKLLEGAGATSGVAGDDPVQG
ncbi:hypothetical protein ACWGDT_24305 [Streptomyces avermitilis]